MSLESAEQLREVRDLIADAFSPADLEMLVMDHLGVPLANLVAPGPHLQRVFELLQACQARAWLDRLLDGVAAERHEHPEVTQLMQRVGRPTALSASGRGVAAAAAAGARSVSAIATAPPDVAAHAVSKRRDEELQALVKQLDDAYARKKQLEEIDEPTTELAREILDLKRRLRGDGGHLRSGDRLGGDGRYQLIQQVGRGGFAVVWKAKDRHDEIYVAIKVLHANLSGDSHRRERFFRGARMMQRLDHPAVVRVLDPYCEDGGFWYFVMEFVPNGTLHDAVLTKGLSGNEALLQVIRVGEALAKAHAQGIVHRDIKPQNILLDEKLEAKLTDFDLVGAGDTTGGTRTSAMGTVIYAAPECLEKPQEATARADVFGLGMTAIFVLAGRVLTLSTLRNPEPTIARLDCSEDVKKVLRRAVAWEPEQRFADAREMVAALKKSLDKHVEQSMGPAHAKLVVLSSNFAGKTFELSRPLMIIGRTDENDIAINHRSISRNHAKLVREPETGRYILSDLQSSEGVRVNGADYGTVELRRGDVIDLGHVRLRFIEAGEDFVFARDAVITNVPEAGGRRGMAVALLATILVMGAGIAAVYWLRGSSTTDQASAPTDSPASGAVVPDAPDPIDADVGPTGDGVVALSRYGFFSIAANAKTQIYVDNNKIGDTPLTRMPLPPGPHKVNAIGPRGKVKQLDITIYGGRDTDEGTINW